MTASKTRAAGTRPAAAFIPEDPDELGGFEEPAESAVSEPEEPAAEPVLAARPGPLGGVARRGKARQARQGEARQGMSWHGAAWRGRQGRLGMAGCG